MPTYLNSPKVQKKKLSAKKPSTAARSKRSGRTATLDPNKTLVGLKKKYPDAHCELVADSPFQLLVATILSAQCTDKRVNIVTQDLFKHYPNAQSMSKAPLEHLEKLVQSTGFYKNKAKNILATSKLLIEKYEGEVPRTLEELQALPGVGRKTGNVVLGNSYGIASGVVVDTHVGRLALRWGWTRSKNPEIAERDLQKIIPFEDWILVSHLLIQHGRGPCQARSPKCESCFLFDACPRIGL